MKNNKKLLPWKEAWQINKRALTLMYGRYPKMVKSRIANTLWEALTPYAGISLSALIIEELAGRRDSGRLLLLVLITLISAAMISLISALLTRYQEIECAAMRLQARYLLSEKSLDMDYCIIDDPKTHEKLSIITQNMLSIGRGQISRSVRHFENLLSALFTLFGGIALTVTLFTSRVSGNESMAFLNSPLFLLLLIVVMLAVTIVSPMLHTKAESYRSLNSDNLNLGNRIFSHYAKFSQNKELGTDIRIYRQDILCKNHLQDKTDTFGSKGFFAKLARGPIGFYSGAGAATSSILTGTIYLFVCLKAWAGAFGIGMVTQYISSISKLAGGVSSLFSTAGDMRNEASFLKLTFDYLDIPNVMYQGSLTTEKRNDRQYEVEFRDVSFKYPGSEQYSLRHVNMKFNVGQRLAVVGQNGSGKTTFIKLLCRLYDPTEGVILLNGIDIRKYDYQDYISIFSVVFQDFTQTCFTLGQNVAAKTDYDRVLVESCLEKAGFGERLKTLKAGTDTYLSKYLDEEGVDMSGGERQKIAIARTLYKNAPFIVLDEPTAALDPIAEAEIYSKFNDIIEDKTAIYISHRLSSCRFCDDILVFDKGSVVQQGSHDTLVTAQDGKYYELWHAQAQYYEADNAGKESQQPHCKQRSC